MQEYNKRRFYTGTLQFAPIRLAPAVATVITAADIKAMGTMDLDQVLESVPGLHVTRQAGTYTSNYLSDIASGLDRAFGTHASLAPGPVNKNYNALDANLDLNYGQWRWRSSYKLRDDVGTGVRGNRGYHTKHG